MQWPSNTGVTVLVCFYLTVVIKSLTKHNSGKEGSILAAGLRSFFDCCAGGEFGGRSRSPFAPILTDQETETGQEVELICKIPGPTQSDSLPSERLHLQKVPEPPLNRTTSWEPHVPVGNISYPNHSTILHHYLIKG